MLLARLPQQCWCSHHLPQWRWTEGEKSIPARGKLVSMLTSADVSVTIYIDVITSELLFFHIFLFHFGMFLISVLTYCTFMLILAVCSKIAKAQFHLGDNIVIVILSFLKDR